MPSARWLELLLEDPCRRDRLLLPARARDGKRLSDVGADGFRDIAVVGPVSSAIESAVQVFQDPARRSIAQAVHLSCEEFAIFVELGFDDSVDGVFVLAGQLVHHLVALSLVSRWFWDPKTPNLELRADAERRCLAQFTAVLFTSFLVLMTAPGSRSRCFVLRKRRPSGC